MNEKKSIAPDPVTGQGDARTLEIPNVEIPLEPWHNPILTAGDPNVLGDLIVDGARVLQPGADRIDTSDIQEANEEFFKNAKLKMPARTPDRMIQILRSVNGRAAQINVDTHGRLSEYLQQLVSEAADMIERQARELKDLQQ